MTEHKSKALMNDKTNKFRKKIKKRGEEMKNRREEEREEGERKEQPPQLINDVPNLCPWIVVQSMSQRLLLCRTPSLLLTMLELYNTLKSKNEMLLKTKIKIRMTGDLKYQTIHVKK